MNGMALTDTIALGALTGMRSMAGPATLALNHGGILGGIVSVLAAGEMVADKTSVIGNRIDPIPLAGRAAMGALVGGIVARENSGSLLAGAVLGAASAVIMAHIAYRVRKSLPVSSALGGVIEDAIVMAIGARYATAASTHRASRSRQ